MTRKARLSSETPDRMAARVRILEFIDNKRAETGNTELGDLMEHLILRISLREIEDATALTCGNTADLS